MICLRCGCEIQPGLGAWIMDDGERIDIHAGDDCMVALRRKEIELAAKRSEEHETQ